jgi:hypothetical protein
MNKFKTFIQEKWDWFIVFNKVFGKYLLIPLLLVLCIYLFTVYFPTPPIDSLKNSEKNVNTPKQEVTNPNIENIVTDKPNKTFEFAISSIELYNEYYEDFLKYGMPTKGKYSGKKIKVTGKIYSILHDHDDNEKTVIILAGNEKGDLGAVYCFLNHSETKKSKSFKNGLTISIVGTLKGAYLTFPKLADCSIE